MRTRWDLGDAVRVVRNLRNDGTYPGAEIGELLIRAGTAGTVIDVGTFLIDQIIYTVHFLDAGNRSVGCRENELIPAEAPWMPNRFERGDRVSARLALATGDERVAASGATGEIIAVIREPEAIHYHVLFGQRVFRVPEDALCGYSMSATDFTCTHSS